MYREQYGENAYRSCKGLKLFVIFPHKPYKVVIRQSKLLVINPLLPNISMHILHTVLYTFPKVLTRGISLMIQSLCSY